MKYDIRINNIFFKEIEGENMEKALNNSGMDVDFTSTGPDCGRIHYDRLDIAEMLGTDTSDELIDSVKYSSSVSVEFGPVIETDY